MIGAGGRAGAMTIVRVAVPAPPALLAATVATVVPATVGVPLIVPVLVLSVRPAGNDVAEKLVGVCVPVIVKVNNEFTWPFAVFSLVTPGGIGAPTSNRTDK